MHLPNTLNALLLLGLMAGAAQAQTPPPLPKNDAAISLGWLGAEYPGLQRYDRWHQSVFSGAGVGHYWNDHFKTEVEAAWMSRVKVDAYGPEDLDDATAYVRSLYRFQNIRVSVGQVYQFGENAWVHPFAGLGADVDRLTTAEERPQQTATVLAAGRTSFPIAVAQLSERDTSVRVRPFVKGGFKMYASDRVFFTTEWKFGLGDGLRDVLWKTGFGVDF